MAPVVSQSRCSYLLASPVFISDFTHFAIAIDHVQALLAERAALSLRLHQARGALPPGHPALAYSPHHLDDKGALLWEREWTGGTGWGDVEDDGGDDE